MVGECGRENPKQNGVNGHVRKGTVGGVLTGHGISRIEQGAYCLVGGEEVACLHIVKPASAGTAAAACQFFNRSSTARIRLGSD